MQSGLWTTAVDPGSLRRMARPLRFYYHAWLREADWSRWGALSEDLPDSYEQWRSAAEEAIANSKAQPWQVRRIEIDPEDYVAWCRARGRLHNAASRALYATFLGTKAQGQDPEEG